MKAKSGRPNAHPTIHGMETLGKKKISGHFSNSGDGKKGEHEKHGSGGGIGGLGKADHPKAIGFEGKGKNHTAVGFSKK